MAAKRARKREYKFQRVADAIKERVDSGLYRDGERLPSQHRMAAEFGVAFNTFKTALDVLEAEGYVVRRVGNGTYVANPKTGRPRALVVDDDSGVRAYLVAALDRCGWDCTAVASGPLGLEELERSSFDLILLDLLMPGMDGSKVIVEIRKRDPAAEVVIITAYPESDLMEAAMEAGPFAVLRKPARLDDLRRVLATAKGGVGRTL